MTRGIKMKKNYRMVILFQRGPERIRTAVGAFAELSLATRPQDLIFCVDCRHDNIALCNYNDKSFLRRGKSRIFL